jgi:hypothetical protein
MWTYDGEEWIEEGVNKREKKMDQVQRPEEESQLELEVVKIVPTPRTNYNPPPPLP